MRPHDNDDNEWCEAVEGEGHERAYCGLRAVCFIGFLGFGTPLCAEHGAEQRKKGATTFPLEREP